MLLWLKRVQVIESYLVNFRLKLVRSFWVVSQLPNTVLCILCTRQCNLTGTAGCSFDNWHASLLDQKVLMYWFMFVARGWSHYYFCKRFFFLLSRLFMFLTWILFFCSNLLTMTWKLFDSSCCTSTNIDYLVDEARVINLHLVLASWFISFLYRLQ